MRKIGPILTIVFFAAGIVIAFFAGDYMSDQSYIENRAEQFDKYISFAIDTAEDKGLSVDGASESIASNLWVAHEFCDNPEISAELNDLWNTLVYDEDVFVGQEDRLTMNLRDILERYK